MKETAKRAALATLVVGGIVLAALALWKLKLVLALLFFAFIIAAAMRPGIEWLKGHGVPRGIGLLLHYLALFALVGLFLWVVVPRAVGQVQSALGTDTKAQIHRAAKRSTGVKHTILTAIDNRLRHLPKAGTLVHPAVTVTVKAFEVLLGIFFTLATAAYWIFERPRAMDFVASVLPRPRRKKMRDTWDLIDLKLGAFVRGQLLLILLVGTVLSLAFMTIGEPYWILVGAFAGIVEIVPVIGPLAAGALAIGVGFTDSWHTALAAGLCVLGVRLVEDYLVVPRVLGDAVGLSPLLVLVSVTAVGILFGGFAVILAVPIAAVLVTLLDVIVLDKDPAEEDPQTGWPGAHSLDALSRIQFARTSRTAAFSLLLKVTLVLAFEETAIVASAGWDDGTRRSLSRNSLASLAERATIPPLVRILSARAATDTANGKSSAKVCRA